MLCSRGEEVLEPLAVTYIVGLEYFGGICGVRVGAGVVGVVGRAGGEERLLGAVVVVGHGGLYGWLVLIWRVKGRIEVDEIVYSLLENI